jgi:hypothetical protein
LGQGGDGGQLRSGFQFTRGDLHTQDSRDTAVQGTGVVRGQITNFEAVHWMGVFMPANTPQDVIDRLQQQIAMVLRDPERSSRLVRLGIEPVGSTPSEFRSFLAADRERFLRMFEASGLKPE